ncbi:hypothetical protein ES319_D04G203500v1 [Gossypium barbadense]|uniref:TF-B3 domain-containing protein n=2 Tax=Gossypium TaxID=3633 RepID=A0A5J5RXU7_GOSBA|nr:hypothetical protein ES319_D04G203500v1 [Gossypium barbadense]PPD66940.1 hypothetical protein GOBAR_DD36183 [Gossypium barbadense]TYG74822.1 hypothetical protein ES288_D04G213900v1 [Gossypium darwinii]
MAIEKLQFIKRLTKTDIGKRLSVPSKKKRCFLDFDGRHQVDVKVKDDNGKDWLFGCSKRRGRDNYPKPVLSKGWLQFVRCWKLAVGDIVIVNWVMEKDGKGNYRIKVIRTGVLPLVQNRDADRAIASNSSTERTITYDRTEGLRNLPKFIDFLASDSQQREMEHPSNLALHNINVDEVLITSSAAPYSKLHDADRVMAVAAYTDVEQETTITFAGTELTVSYDQTEGLHNQPGFMFEFISQKPDETDRKSRAIDCSDLGSQEQREMEHPSILALHNINMVKMPVTSSRTPYIKFF